MAFLLILLFSLFVISANGQVNQKGRTLTYTKKSPIPNVIVSAAGAQDKNNKTKEDGTFSLWFRNAQKGDPVGDVYIRSNKYVFQNKDEIKRANLGANDLIIYLRDAQSYNREKRQYANAAITKRERDLQKELSKTTPSKPSNKQSDEIKEKFLNEVEIEKYSDLIARIDREAIDRSLSEALDLFYNGSVTEAVNKIGEQNYIDQLKQYIQEVDPYKAAIHEIAEKEIANENGHKIYNSIKTQIYLCCLIRDYDMAKKLQISLTNELNTFEELLSCGELCADIKDYDSAISCYKKALSVLSSKTELSKTYKSYWEITIQKELETLYFTIKHYRESSVICHKIINDMNQISKDSLSQFLPLLAEIYYLAGGLDYEISNLKESELMYENAYRIAKGQYEEITPASLAFQARILRCLKEVYKQEQNWEKEQQVYQEARMLKHKLDNESGLSLLEKSSVLLDLAEVYSMHGFVYRSEENMQRSLECDAMHEEALSMSKTIASEDPQSYEPFYASMLNSTAHYYMTTTSSREVGYGQRRSEELYKEVLSIYNKLSAQYPDIYDATIAHTIKSLAYLCLSDTLRYQECEKLYNTALEQYKVLVRKYPNLYDDELAGCYQGLGTLYLDNGKDSKSIEMFSQALQILKKLSTSNHFSYLAQVAEVSNRMASIYRYSLHDSPKAEQSYYETVSAYKNLNQQYELSGNTVVDLLFNISNLEELLLEQGKYSNLPPLIQDMLRYLNADIEKWNNGIITYRYVDYLGDQSFYSILTGDFSQAERISRQAISLRPNQNYYYGNLAAALLLQGKYSEAKSIYEQYKDILKQDFLGDLDLFEKAGIIPPGRINDIERIKHLLGK